MSKVSAKPPVATRTPWLDVAVGLTEQLANCYADASASPAAHDCASEAVMCRTIENAALRTDNSIPAVSRQLNNA